MVAPAQFPDPKELLRAFRRSYVNFYKLWGRGRAVPPGARLQTPADAPISLASLPPAIRALLDEYRKGRPRREITLVKYMRVVDGAPREVVEDESGLPPDDGLLSLGQTISLVAHDSAHVATDVWVARVR